MKDRPGVFVPTDMLALLRHWDNDIGYEDYKFGLQADPNELFQYILNKLEKVGCVNHPLVNGDVLVSRYLSKRSCRCKPNDTVAEEVSIENVLQLNHSKSEGASLCDCFDS